MLNSAGLYASIIGKPTTANSVGVYGESINQQGVVGTTASGAGVQGSASSAGYGVLGIASSASAIAINAVNSYGGTALRVNGLMTMTNPALVTNLNADMLDNWHAGNSSGSIPISNGLTNTNLNADMVDGYHVSNSSGGIPLSNTTWQTNLAAEWAFQAARLYDGNWGHYMYLGTAGGVAGSYTPTFGSACPRPGPPTWVQIIIDGNTGYWPVFF